MKHRLIFVFSFVALLIFFIFAVQEVQAAFPSISTTATTNGTAATAAPVVNLPASIVSGNTLIVLIRVATAGAIGWPAGWTELFDDASDASNDQTAAAWRLADGTEGATITLSSASGKFAAVAWNIADAADPTITPPQFATLAVGTSANPDPASLSPTGGAKDYLWLAVGGWEGEQTSPPDTFPANYTLNQIGADSGIAGAVATNVRVAGGGRQLNAATEDPGTYTISVSDDWTATTIVVHPPPPSHLEQSGYRWFRNTDSPDLASAVVNPSTSTDEIFGLDLDKGDELLYLAGNIGTATSGNAWRIERRNAKTGFLDYSVTSDPSSGNDEPRDLDFVNSENRIYIAGYDNEPGNREWRIEKRKARTGELVYAVTNNPSVGADQANAIAVDSAAGFMYIVGTDSTGVDEGWRIEKRSTNDGSLVYATSSNFSTSSDVAKSIAIDAAGGHMYVAGSESLSATDSQWRIEKRNLSDGSLVFATTTNPSSALDNLNAVAIGSSSMFIVGRDRAVDSGEWRIERRSTSTGALMYATTSNPSGAVDEAFDIEVHDNNNVMYVIGEESNAWRIEKRSLGDGAFVTAFGTNGAVTSDPSGSADVPNAAVLDKNDDNLYLAGRDASPGDGEWRVSRYNAVSGNTNWGNSLNSLNTSSTFPARRTAVRLRTLIHVGSSTLATSSQSFKLQHATSSGVCDTGFVGETYVDVATSTGDIRFTSNQGVSSSVAALPNFRDPTHSGHNIAEQNYVDGGAFSNSVSQILAGEDGLWDFVIQNFSAPAGTTYCFRIVKSDSSLLNTYSQIPEITTSASLASAANQVFEFGQATTTAETVTVAASVGSGGAITATNDIRIKIDGADAKMVWDTSITTPSFGGASLKVAGTVSYPDSKTLLVDVTSDFASGEALSISNLAFAQFTDVNAAAAVLRLFVDGSADGDDDDSNDKTIAVKGKITQKEHSSGLVDNKLDAGASVLATVFFGFKLEPEGEDMDLTTTTVDLILTGFAAGNITNAKLYLDTNGNNAIDGGDTQLGSNGTVAVSNGTGTIIFSNTGSVTTTRDIILTADVASIDDGDFMTFSLPSTKILTKGKVSKEFTNGKGAASSKNHGKPIRKRGGGGGAEGGGPPDSGSQGGGGAGGGGGGAPLIFCNVFPNSPFCKPFEIKQEEANLSRNASGFFRDIEERLNVLESQIKSFFREP